MNEPRCRVYLLTPPRIDLDDFAGRLETAFSGGDVACVQLRLKGVEDEAVRKAAERLMPIAHAHDAAFLINDRPDLAAAVGADGVHLGQGDPPVAEARRLLGHDRDIGVSCHASRDLAFAAGEAGADYVAFGAFFPTTTKARTAHADPAILRWWSEIAELPAVAIGGITAENCAPLVTAGADFLAVSSYVWAHTDGPAAAIRALNDAIARASERKWPSPDPE